MVSCSLFRRRTRNNLVLLLIQIITTIIISNKVVSPAFGKQNEGYDLDCDAKLRIGIKKRIPLDQCHTKSKKGDIIKVHYVGSLYKNGEEFDSSRERNQPFTFQLGSSSVIKGWDQGLSNMCIGEVRKLTIPSDLAYGLEGSPPKIHPEATLVFEIELLKIIDEENHRDEYLDYIELSHFTEL